MYLIYEMCSEAINTIFQKELGSLCSGTVSKNGFQVNLYLRKYTRNGKKIYCLNCSLQLLLLSAGLLPTMQLLNVRSSEREQVCIFLTKNNAKLCFVSPTDFLSHFSKMLCSKVPCKSLRNSTARKSVTTFANPQILYFSHTVLQFSLSTEVLPSDINENNAFTVEALS